jgi:hypothetical protein
MRLLAGLGALAQVNTLKATMSRSWYSYVQSTWQAMVNFYLSKNFAKTGVYPKYACNDPNSTLLVRLPFQVNVP